MELNLSQEDAAFRDEVRSFIAENYPSEMRVPNPETDLSKEKSLLWHRILHRKGWIAPLWPKQYGGPGWSLTQRFIWEQETSRAGTLPPLAFSVTMVGPVIYTYGSEAQKSRFLPRILSGEDWWCQGYSEPGSGSDLASVRTKAVRDGDHYVVNGHKEALSLTQHLVLSLTDSEDGVSKLASGAKAKVGYAARFVGEQAIQLHGGMGMSDELDVGHYFKRIGAIDILFGDPAFHLMRFARAS